jgi:hypothetical protein
MNKAVVIDVITGKVDITTLGSGSEKSQPEYIKPTTTLSTSSVDTFQKIDSNPTTTQESTITTVLPNKGTLNYAQVIPYLISKYKIK